MRHQSQYNRYEEQGGYGYQDTAYGPADRYSSGSDDMYNQNGRQAYGTRPDNYEQRPANNRYDNSRTYEPQARYRSSGAGQHRNNNDGNRRYGNDRYNNGNREPQYARPYPEAGDNDYDRYNNRNDYSRNEIGGQPGYNPAGYREANYGAAAYGHHYDRENQYTSGRRQPENRNGYQSGSYNQNRPVNTRPEWGDEHQHQHDWHSPESRYGQRSGAAEWYPEHRDQYDRWSGNRYDGPNESSYSNNEDGYREQGQYRNR